MTRIIAGTYGGRRLLAPTGRDTRPTTDRARESLFSRLDHLGVLDRARVLDLYAGSGALGLEALSRGAAEAVLVETAAGAARVASRNVRELKAPAEVVVADADRYLRRVGSRIDQADGTALDTALGDAEVARQFDVAFLDPPYDLTQPALARTLGLLVPLLAPEAVVVVERSTRSDEPEWPAGLRRFASKSHGETALWYAEPNSGSASEPAPESDPESAPDPALDKPADTDE